MTINNPVSIPLAAVVRRFLRDNYVVDVAFAQAGVGQPDEHGIACAGRATPAYSHSTPCQTRRPPTNWYTSPDIAPLYGTRPSMPSGTNFSAPRHRGRAFLEIAFCAAAGPHRAHASPCPGRPWSYNSHYKFRSNQEEASATNEPIMLADNDEWVKRYYNSKDIKYKERNLFCK